ncbi:Glycogen debranching enzyme (alpha-1,6-glucosidase) [Bacillus sp. OV166]|uniref:amylo-alpha-1,6-glucosidase n=1 Tax=Bacillus sp. OV166 TaxID=1882763 RepID=UPI000A2ADFF3|nr:amylo-alpha-1,6-glucosidase [Bacillus sp. OV166]SMQ63225.1 Glycogen debranching enzyme (alpha-1,6-glucosidase) [Bacillus sp. OV166]
MDYQVIKEGDLFILTDKNGDITGSDDNGHGLYTKDTRFLSRMEIFIDGEKPSLLSSTADKSYVANFRLMKVKNDDGAIEIVRDRLIYDGVHYEKLSFTNFFPRTKTFDFTMVFDADFQDMFIVRKYRTGDVGQIISKEVDDQAWSVQYQGSDEVQRETKIHWNKKGAQIDSDGNIHFSLTLAPKEKESICFFIVPMIDGTSGTVLSYEDAYQQIESSYQKWYEETTKVTTNSRVFNELYQRGSQDLRMLMTDVGYGEIPVAGLPWFAVPFGRDSLITSLFMLPLNPEKVKGTLRTLAAYQGSNTDLWRDEQPGKIMHEIRFGELVNTNQSPFSPYYGSVDATPLFLVLAGEYFRWTGDLSLIKELIPNILLALAWMDEVTKESGFLTYHQEAEKGFPNQGWKDSSNSVVHQTGEYAKSPIALAEVQGYAYQAKKSFSPIFSLLGDERMAEKLAQEAEELKNAFENAFWMEKEQYYAIALDRDQNQVQSVTSNPGHLLFSGLPSSIRSDKIAERLLSSDMFSGYGIRTMSTEATGYYPMSYHNGSIWPHDNAMILLGLSRLGYQAESSAVVTGLLEASKGFEYQRLPELFCGYQSELGYPVPYPSTCSPQAWAAGTSMVFVQAMLGITPNALEKEITLAPVLPDLLDELVAENIRIGAGYLSLKVVRSKEEKDQFTLDILENTTGLAVNHSKNQYLTQV